MKFPKNFLFGSATSAHQIEGNQENDWSKWEKIPSHISDGSNSQVACDSWNKWREDLELLKNTNQNAYRFSIEWSKVEPNEGEFDEKAIEHYKKVLLELKRNNIKAMVTLFHFTLPIWLAQKGGFANKKSPIYFARFAKKIGSEMGNLIDFWSILNEPNVYVQKGYLQGAWCPGERNVFRATKVYFNLIKAHKLSQKEIKKINPDSSVGIAMAIIAYLPYSHNLSDNLLVKIAKFFSYNHFLNKIEDQLDFIGINHYFQTVLKFSIPVVIRDKTASKSDYNWPIHPEGIYNTIKDQSFRQKPIYITESGVADNDDKIRHDYIKNCLEMVGRAVNERFDVRGYFHWSLLDNFEWAAGYSQKFGLFTIDRKPRKSADVYWNLIAKYSSK